MHRCLIIFIFLEISWLFLPACFVGKGNIWSCWNRWMEAGYRHDDVQEIKRCSFI